MKNIRVLLLDMRILIEKGDAVVLGKLSLVIFRECIAPSFESTAQREIWVLRGEMNPCHRWAKHAVPRRRVTATVKNYISNDIDVLRVLIYPSTLHEAPH